MILLEELWYGNINFQEQGTGYTSKVKEITKRMDDSHDILFESMTDQQKDWLEQYDDSVHEMYSIFEKDAFVIGVRFATGFLVETMYDAKISNFS